VGVGLGGKSTNIFLIAKELKTERAEWFLKIYYFYPLSARVAQS
jgi:hypothetical protein